jgi:hypothetical protein
MPPAQLTITTGLGPPVLSVSVSACLPEVDEGPVNTQSGYRWTACLLGYCLRRLRRRPKRKRPLELILIIY